MASSSTSKSVNVFFITTLFIVFFFRASSSSSCRCIAGESCFPSSRLWDQFNRTINGSLISVTPPAYPCYKAPYSAQCAQARANWTSSVWRSQQVGAAEHPNWEAYNSQKCPLPPQGGTAAVSSSGCQQGSVPVYAVNATSRQQIQAAVRFAWRHSLRLVIKNTGHDYHGRSSGRGSLSIWTHSMDKIQFHDQFQPHSCRSSNVNVTPAVEVEAGVQWKDLYSAAHSQRRLLVGALSTSVGAAGGYVLGGGHSPLSPHYGLAADNALQFEVVTADGTARFANPCVNPRLFWALRGGGGGTFGVVTSVVYKTHPAVDTILSTVQVIEANTSTDYRALISEFGKVHKQMNGRWAGYFIMFGTTLVMRYIAVNQSVDFATSEGTGMNDFVRYVEHHPRSFRIVSSRIETYPDFLSWYNDEMCGFYGSNNCVDEVGINRALVSRLVPRSLIETKHGQVADALLSLMRANATTNRILGIFVGGGNVAEERDNAVNPAWRDALWHITAEANWDDSLELGAVETKMAGITEANAALREITPTSGAYFNEADYNEPDWQESLFGDKYDRLLEVKGEFDPDGVFVCWHCVGSEQWSSDLDCLFD